MQDLSPHTIKERLYFRPSAFEQIEIVRHNSRDDATVTNRYIPEGGFVELVNESYHDVSQQLVLPFLPSFRRLFSSFFLRKNKPKTLPSILKRNIIPIVWLLYDFV